MPTYDLAFVDSITASPTTRLNLHVTSGTGWQCLAEGSDFPPPPLDRIVAESMMTDGATVPAAAYRNRSITLALDLGMSLSPDAAAAQFQLLLREIDRPGGPILRYRPDTTNSVFFQVFRSAPDAVLWDPFQRRAVVTLMAEPFAYGAKETQSAVNVTSDPASGTNPMRWDIAAPKGDVETPLTMTIANGATGLGATGRIRSVFAIRRRGTVGSAPFLLQCESMTQGADTSVLANSTFSGGNAARCTFATLPGGQRRVYTATTFPAASVDARGSYRVFARIRKTVGTDSIDMELQWGDTNNVTSGGIITLPANTGFQYVDLGVMQIPNGYDPVFDGKSGVELSTEGSFISLFARRNSGSGNLDMDHLLFMPADDRQMSVKWPTVQAFSTDTFVVAGGDETAAYCLTASNTLRSVEPIEITGKGLMLAPGRTNRIYMIRDVATGTAAAGGGDVLTATHNITTSYFPRYLSPVRPAAT